MVLELIQRLWAVLVDEEHAGQEAESKGERRTKAPSRKHHFASRSFLPSTHVNVHWNSSAGEREGGAAFLCNTARSQKLLYTWGTAAWPLPSLALAALRAPFSLPRPSKGKHPGIERGMRDGGPRLFARSMSPNAEQRLDRIWWGDVSKGLPLLEG